MNVIIIILTIFFQSIVHGGFAAHTSVTLPMGGFIAIKDIQVGDKVLCRDEKNGYISQEVIAIQSHQVHDCVCVILDNAHIITAHNQKFYLSDHKRWKIAGYLQPGDRLLGKLGQTVLVKYVLKIPRSVKLYDFTVKEYHNFLVSKHGIVAHNFIPAVAVGVSIAFGSGAVELAGITIGIGALTLGLGGLVSWLNNRREEQEFWKMDPVPLPNVQAQQNYASLQDMSGHSSSIVLGSKGSDGSNGQAQTSTLTVPMVPGSLTVSPPTNTENSLAEAVKTTIVNSVTQTAMQYANSYFGGKTDDKEEAHAEQKREKRYKCPFHKDCDRVHPHGLYEGAKYHHQNSKGGHRSGKSACPVNGQWSLDCSRKASDSATSRYRIGFNGSEFAVFSYTGKSVRNGIPVDIWHGHVRSWNQLEHEMRNVAYEQGWATLRGKILK